MSCFVCVVRRVCRAAKKTNRSKWSHVEVFAKQDGYTVLFDLISQSLHWRYPEIAQFGLEIIYMTCLVTHPPACVRALGILTWIRVVVVAVRASADCEHFAGIERARHCDHSRRGLWQSAPHQGNAFLRIPRCHERSVPTLAHTHARTTPNLTRVVSSVGSPLAALGIIWVMAGLSRDEEMLKHVWKSIRASNGIRILLSLLRIREPASHAGTPPPPFLPFPAGHWLADSWACGVLDAIRSLACRALLGIARDPTICQILSKLHITSRLLPDLMRYPPSPPTHQPSSLLGVV